MGRRPQKLELTWFNKDQALIPTEEGKYGYTWVDPKDPRYCETHTLITEDVIHGTQAPREDGVTYSERADLTPTEDNLLILGESGDVLEALTRVPELAEIYVGQVKCIYIDPPFNTAQTFANYEDNLEHSIWLTMMRDRLIHLRQLLSDDGSIWVHLDDVENHRMRVLMDEIFGAANYVAEMQWQKTYAPRNDSRAIPMATDVIYVYRKSLSFSPNRLPRTAGMNAKYGNPDADPKGLWRVDNSSAPGAATHQGMLYGIQHPLSGEMIYPARNRCWALGQEKLLTVMREWGDYVLGDLTESEIARQSVIAGPLAEPAKFSRPLVLPEGTTFPLNGAEEILKNGPWPLFYVSKKPGTGFTKKSYLADVADRTPSNFLPFSEVGHSDGANKEIKALFPSENPFTTPKPERLLERIIHIATNPDDIVLDVFAGSGTTAAVAHKMGRRWVTCELVEDTINRFTRPRLEKVVRGEDPGGVTSTREGRVDATKDGLPEDVDAAEAFKLMQGVRAVAKHVSAPVELNKLVNTVVREDAKSDEPVLDSSDVKELRRILRKLKAAGAAEVNLLPDVQRVVGQRLKTAESSGLIHWRGGGGFQVARLAPACFDYDPELDLVTLTEAATGQVLVESVAANLNFRLTPDHRYFHGVRGAMRLVVVEGRLDRAKVDDLITHLAEGEGLTIAATEIDDGVRQYLRSLGRGCRAVHVPNEIFPYSSAKEQ